MRVLLFTLSLFLLLGCNKMSGGSIKPINIEKFSQDEDLSINDINKLNNGNVEIDYDPETGYPREIWGLFTTLKIFNKVDAVKSLSSVLSVSELPAPCFIVIVYTI